MLKRDQSERCWNDPTRGAQYPTPAVLRGIELHALVDGFEFPSPKPIRLSPFCEEQPADRQLEARSIPSDRDQAQNGEGGCPATF
jgi:hypothetical protein